MVDARPRPELLPVDAAVAAQQGRIMRFFSDNAAPVHPKVMAALADANTLDTAYDGDARSQSLDARLSDLFEAEVTALWVPTGTAANCLALAALCPPHGGVVCHRDAHIQNDEGGAPEFYTHGAKLYLADGEGAKLTPGTITDVIDAIANDVHRVQPHAISITNATEYGRVYTPTRSGRSVRWRASGGWRCTWTAHASPTRWRPWAVRRPK
jgi:threonine aldolase